MINDSHPYPGMRPEEVARAGMDSPPMIEQLDKVTEVTEQETSKLLVKLETIADGLAMQNQVLTQTKLRLGEGADAKLLEDIDKVAELGQAAQNVVFESMDLLQFQDITRQKLEKVAAKLEELMAFIDVTLGRQSSSIKRKRSYSRTIEETSVVPDANKGTVDAILAEFMPERK